MPETIHKPTNHGETKPLPTPPKKRLRVPMSLQTGVIEHISGSFTYTQAVERYGLWKVRALTEITFFGPKMQPGDTCELPGSVALVAAQYGDVEFVDSRMDEEDRVAAEAARLNIPLAAKNNPAFQRK